MAIVQPALRAEPRWRPSPMITVSILAHVVAAATAATWPETWPFVLAVIVGNHLLLGVAGLLPRSSLLGPNWSRLPERSAARGEIALTVDDGPDPQVTPRVLDILDQFDAQATFFCVGDKALLHPDICREIVRRGHAIENHSQSHSYQFAAFGPRRIALDVDRGQETVHSLTGVTPRFFRPAAGLRSVFLDPVLARRGLRLVSWTRRGFDTREHRADVVYRRLTRNLRARDILLLHDGNSALTDAGVPVILEVLPRLLHALREAKLHSVTLRSAIP